LGQENIGHLAGIYDRVRLIKVNQPSGLDAMTMLFLGDSDSKRKLQNMPVPSNQFYE
jgi:hypothetical protein